MDVTLIGIVITSITPTSGYVDAGRLGWSGRCPRYGCQQILLVDRCFDLSVVGGKSVISCVALPRGWTA